MEIPIYVVLGMIVGAIILIIMFKAMLRKKRKK
jgi:hypothetical protein